MASEKTAPNIRTRSGAVRKRSTIAMNNAFAALRAQIPNLPPDTNLSKIRTLRLATRYNKFLMEILEERDQETISNSVETDLPREENTENSVSLITCHLLTTNICETLHLPHHHLHNIWSFLYFDRKRIQNQSRQKTEQDGPSISGKAN